MELLLVLMLTISSCAYAATITTTYSCPVPNNCETDYNPEDCIRLEQGLFTINVGRKECPGCKICIRKADRFVRLLKWATHHEIPAGYLPPSCYETEFVCRTEEFRGIAVFDHGFLFYDVNSYDVHSRHLEEVYPGTGSKVNGSMCSIRNIRDQYFYDTDGRKCFVYEVAYC